MNIHPSVKQFHLGEIMQGVLADLGLPNTPSPVPVLVPQVPVQAMFIGLPSDSESTRLAYETGRLRIPKRKWKKSKSLVSS